MHDENQLVQVEAVVNYIGQEGRPRVGQRMNVTMKRARQLVAGGQAVIVRPEPEANKMAIPQEKKTIHSEASIPTGASRRSGKAKRSPSSEGGQA